MRIVVLAVCTVSLVTAFTSQVAADQFDGLYHPSGADWSCSPDQIGMDGGALAIRNGVFDGVENRCNLTTPQPDGDGTTFTATCSAEGSTFEQQVTITPTANGVSIERDGFTSYWSRCLGSQTTTSVTEAPQGRWSYGNRAATIVAGASAFELSCEVLNASTTYPTARLMVPCPTCFPNETTQYTLRVDGQFTQDYEFERVSNAEGSVSGLDYYPAWDEGLVAALRAGSVLEVIEEGNVIATFPLVGSSRAIGQLRDMCN